MAPIIQKTAEYVRQTIGETEPGHDWWHIYRVWQLAKKIGETEKADMMVVELGALLHDIADWKFHGGNLETNALRAQEWLKECGLEVDIRTQVVEIVRQVTFKGAGESNGISTLEGKVVQDADRLDAIGAIGVARAFSYGGSKHRAMYDPAIRPQQHTTFEAYKTNKGTTINHFYEKLLLLKDRMNTETGKKIALQRHIFLEAYLEEFYREWEGRG
ncbi:HD domain-containing protein [Candidatus Roizmanbacteria bacterium]|nr:HD domain-containing protein [Candidatus Roizmanbacteria bacterium]